jgi:hypothetical protein
MALLMHTPADREYYVPVVYFFLDTALYDRSLYKEIEIVYITPTRAK